MLEGISSLYFGWVPKQRAYKDAYLCYADCQDHLTLTVVFMVFSHVRPDLTKSGWVGLHPKQ